MQQVVGHVTEQCRVGPDGRYGQQSSDAAVGQPACRGGHQHQTVWRDGLIAGGSAGEGECRRAAHGMANEHQGCGDVQCCEHGVEVVCECGDPVGVAGGGAGLAVSAVVVGDQSHP